MVVTNLRYNVVHNACKLGFTDRWACLLGMRKVGRQTRKCDYTNIGCFRSLHQPIFCSALSADSTAVFIHSQVASQVPVFGTKHSVVSLHKPLCCRGFHKINRDKKRTSEDQTVLINKKKRNICHISYIKLGLSGHAGVQLFRTESQSKALTMKADKKMYLSVGFCKICIIFSSSIVEKQPRNQILILF